MYWVEVKLVQQKGLKFYQTRSNAIILHETLPAYCLPKVVRMETREVIYEKVYASPRPPPKISLKHDWMKELGSEVARQPEGEVARQTKKSQSTEPNPNPNHDIERGDPLFAQKERSVLRKAKHVPLVEKMQITIERGDPLFAHKERLRHVSLVKARTSIWTKKQITKERRDPLFAHSERINSLLKTMRQNQNCRQDPDHSCTG